MAEKQDETGNEQNRLIALLWGEPMPPKRGPRPKLSAIHIATKAIALADAHGLEAVSMQRLAAEFDFTTMSLYRYIPSKNDLVDLMVDLAFGAPPEFDDGDWRDQLTTWAHRCLDRYRTHLWLLGAATARRRIMGPNEIGWLESALDVLQRARLAAEQRHDAFLLVNGHVRNMALEIVNQSQPGVDEWRAAMAKLFDQQSDRFPAFHQTMSEGGMKSSFDNRIDIGLEFLLDGIAKQARQATEAKQAKRA